MMSLLSHYDVSHFPFFVEIGSSQVRVTMITCWPWEVGQVQVRSLCLTCCSILQCKVAGSTCCLVIGPTVSWGKHSKCRMIILQYVRADAAREYGPDIWCLWSMEGNKWMCVIHMNISPVIDGSLMSHVTSTLMCNISDTSLQLETCKLWEKVGRKHHLLHNLHVILMSRCLHLWLTVSVKPVTIKAS